MKSLKAAGTALGLSLIILSFGRTPDWSWVNRSFDNEKAQVYHSAEGDSIKNGDSTKLRFPISDHPLYGEKRKNNLDLKDPEVIKRQVEFDTSDFSYKEKFSLGNSEFRPVQYRSYEEYLQEREKEELDNYFRKRAQAAGFVRGGGLIPPIVVAPKVLDKIFGGGTIDIRPQGSAELIFSYNHNVVRNPSFTARQQRNGQFDFKQKIQINLTGNIGERLKLATNYDTEATFDFDNQMKLNWAGQEDDIIKKIEVGNVSLPLNSGLINGGSALFGLKGEFQFGRLKVTALVSQQRGQSSSAQITGGAQVTKFNIQADNYDVNRHFFLAQYFAENYDRWLSNLPAIQSPVLINRVEVWVTNRTNDFSNARDVVGYMDLGESTPFNPRWLGGGITFPSNGSNTLFGQIVNDPSARSAFSVVQTLEGGAFSLDKIRDFQFLANARQLNTNEYTFHRQLGYISLNTALNNDEMLCVAFEYSVGGAVYQVGEFTIDVPDEQANPRVLHLKLLKGATVTTQLPIWDLMMKNIYSLGAFNIRSEKFYLDVVYADDFTGADYTYLPVQDEPNVSNRVLIDVLNLDRINVQQEPTPDGVFDYVPGLTINPNNGRVIFPVREPFGSFLASRLLQQENREKYVYQELYDSTKWLAQQVVLKNKFFLRGSFQSASNSEIPLNGFNIPRGSVKVTANGTLLTENVDYTVDYALGRVKIINTALLESGAVITATSESNSMFNIQQKTLIGSRLDYKISDNFMLGSTILHLWERPLTPKVNIGDEPLLNTIIGFDGSYKTESRWLTKMVDKLPFISTKEISTITFNGEYAQLFPHQPRTIGARGTSFIDDFEASETPFDLRLGNNNWFLASTPEGQPDLFPDGNLFGLDAGRRRGKLAWYIIDPIFQVDNLTARPATPQHLRNNTASSSNHYTRMIQVVEVFPNRQLQNMQPQNLATFDLAYYPSERGPYNMNVRDLNADGTLQNPRQNWAGIQRRIETNDFEAANIDYMEFWVMSPFMNDPSLSGTLYLHLGQVSEDVIKDRAKSFENGLPLDPNNPTRIRNTGAAIVPTGRTLNNAFVNEPNAREVQDVGLDGMNDAMERDTFRFYLDSIAAIFGTGSQVYQQALNDPSGDNFRFHSSSVFDNAQLSVLERYKDINNQQGNSPLATFQPDGYPVARTNNPDDEDINGDFTLNTIEEYFQYKIEINQARMVMGENYVADIQVATVDLPDGTVAQVPWYLLRIPVSAFEKRVNGIQDFKSIRFMRVVMKDFERPVVLRFAQMQLVRADWRRYLNSLSEPRDNPPTNPSDNTIFSTGTVNIEENGFRNPVRYVLPPGIFRTVDVTAPNNIQQNEQSISLRVCNLNDGDGRAVFKTTMFDFRNYRRIQAFVHAEEAAPVLRDGDLQAFIRLGTDLEQNYYEFSVPLVVTPAGASSPEVIWPAANELNLELEEFYLTKQLRSNFRVPLTEEFVREIEGGKLVKVKGLPDMGNVRVIMLGVRNPLKTNDPQNDDGLPKCAEVWFNELRVSEFINQGGWAANSRLVVKLADLGLVTASVNYQSIGFGGIDRKLNDRNLNETFMYDVNGTFELGKFFPAKSGISLPMFIGHSEQIIRPKFNPLNPDILLETAIRAAPTEQEANDVKRNAEALTVRRSINFTNVRKNRTGSAKPKLYDIENFNLSYAFSEVFMRDQQTREDLQKTYRSTLAYNYNPNNKAWKPFKKIGKSPWLALFRDMEINPVPRNLAFRTGIDRFYGRRINRNNDNPNTVVPILYNKNFTMNRFYDVGWNVTGNIKFDYQATMNARIDEPQGKISLQETPDSVRIILNNLRSLGRPLNYNQKMTVNYNVPFNKIPILNWITMNAIYTSNYEWLTAPPAVSSLGNTIQNSQNYTLNGQFNFVNLYNKSNYLRDVNRGIKPKTKKQLEEEKQRKKELQERKRTGDNPDEKKEEKKKNDDDNKLGFGPTMLRILMSVRNASVNYSVTNGTILPGFAANPQYFGNNFDINAPGLPFTFGSQDPQIRFNLASANAITRDTGIFSQFSQASNISLMPKARLEPIRDLVIDMQMQRIQIKSTTSIFRYDALTDTYQDFGLQESGSYTISFNSLGTARSRLNGNNQSAAFVSFLNQRFDVSRRLAQEDPRSAGFDPDGYYQGYGRKSQDVLINAFIAAYSGQGSRRSELTPFPKLPFPSWNLTYNGLNRIESLKDYVNNVTIRHAYSSLYAVQSYTTGLTGVNGTTTNGDFQPQFIIQQVTITENLNPLMSIDISWKNNLTTKVEYKSTRMITLNVATDRVLENLTTEFIIGLGIVKKNVRLPITINRKRPVLPNDLNIRFDFSIRDNKTIVMMIDDISAIPAQGNRIVSIKPTIDYKISDKLNLRIFYDRRATTPAIATNFPTAITQGGISLRYTIQ